MSFETTATFLTKAAQEGASDAQQSPSARIVLGMFLRTLLDAYTIATYTVYSIYHVLHTLYTELK